MFNDEAMMQVWSGDLRSPELDVVFAAVEQKQVLADLVEDERLTDGPPRRVQGPHMQHDDQQDQQGNRDRSLDRIDEETHRQ